MHRQPTKEIRMASTSGHDRLLLPSSVSGLRWQSSGGGHVPMRVALHMAYDCLPPRGHRTTALAKYCY